MKKTNNIVILIIAVLLMLISYNLDKQFVLFFKDAELPLLDVFLSIITNFGFVVVVMLIIPSFILYKKNKKSAYLLWLTFATVFIMNFIFKLIFHRQRPIDTVTYPFLSVINYSFPSTHSIVVFSLLPALVKHLPKQKYFFVAIAFLAAFSRIYFNLHFLSDIVFGAILGYFIGYFLLQLNERKQ